MALNNERAKEEKRGHVRWLRPDYRIPRFAKGVDKKAAKEEGAQIAAELIAAGEQKPSFPTDAVEQTAAVFAALAAAGGPLDAKGLAARFERTRTHREEGWRRAGVAGAARLCHIGGWQNVCAAARGLMTDRPGGTLAF